MNCLSRHKAETVEAAQKVQCCSVQPLLTYGQSRQLSVTRTILQSQNLFDGVYTNAILLYALKGGFSRHNYDQSDFNHVD